MMKSFNRRLLGLALWLLVSTQSCIALGEEFFITPASDEQSVAKQVTAGDSVVLEDGLWRNADLKFERLAGTAEAPIRIRARTAGKVVFAGASRFRISGRHLIVSGFVFRDTDGTSDVVQLRTHSERHAHFCRLTDCVFEQTANSPAGSESRWLSIYGTHNRIDHCYFGGKRSPGPTLVVWVSESAEEHSIDHNHFGPRPKLGRNDGETIRIGTSRTSEWESKTTVADNYFHKCDGEAEIVSNKSCGNTYRHNVFDQCSGALTLRHGHRCLVDGNVFLGRKQRGTGGVRIIGQKHSVTNNYFEGLRGDAERAAICLMNGVPNGPLNSYAPVDRATVSHNTFVDCKVSIEIGVGAGKQQSAVPANCRVINNVFRSPKWPLLRIHHEAVTSIWQGNKRQGPPDGPQLSGFESVDLQLDRAADGLLRPTSVEPLTTNVPSDLVADIDGHKRDAASVAGCDGPGSPLYNWPSTSNTGPSSRPQLRGPI